MIAVVSRSRRLLLGLCLSLFLGLVAMKFLVHGAIELNLDEEMYEVRMPVLELGAIVLSAVLGVLFRPRFYEWERVAHSHRARLVSTFCVVFTLLVPAAMVAPAIMMFPEATPPIYWSVVYNSLAMCAIVQLLSPLLTPAIAGALAILIWLGHGVLTNLEPGSVRYSLVAFYSNQRTDSYPFDRWYIAAALMVLAVVVHQRTLGSTALARRMFAAD